MSSNQTLCSDHELAYELHRRATGTSHSDDLPPLLDDWHEFIFDGADTVCEKCLGVPPVELEFYCNREEQLTWFRPFSVLRRLLLEQLERVREEPEGYDPKPVNGTNEDQAAWYRKMIDIALENEEPDQHDWRFVMRASVGTTESWSFVQSRELMDGSTVVALRPFTTLEAALQHRASLGTDDLAALTYEQLRSLAEEDPDA
jgi:hypothetical protein